MRPGGEGALRERIGPADEVQVGRGRAPVRSPDGDQPPAQHRPQGAGLQEAAGDQPAHAVADEGDPLLVRPPPLPGRGVAVVPPVQDAALQQAGVVAVRQPPVVRDHEHVGPGVPQHLEEGRVRPHLPPPAHAQVDVDQRVGPDRDAPVITVAPGQALHPQRRVEEPVEAADGTPQRLRPLVARIPRPAPPAAVTVRAQVAPALRAGLLRGQALVDQDRAERPREEDHPPAAGPRPAMALTQRPPCCRPPHSEQDPGQPP